MSDSPPAPTRTSNYNRRFSKPNNPWIPFVGDCGALDTYLNSKSGFYWYIPKYLNALFRGIAQVTFANNPLTGLLILIALTWTDLIVGLSTVVAATSAIITALVMKQDSRTISAGLTTYNAVLVGSITASLWTPIYNEPISGKLWAFIVLGSVLSVFINSGLGNILSKWSLPSLTMAFNVVILLIFTCLMPPLTHDPSNSPAIVNETSTAYPLKNTSLFDPSSEFNEMGFDEIPGSATSENLNWGEIWNGIVLSMGQVYGVETVFGSILIYIVILVYSPLLCLMSVVGAFGGTLAGIIFTPGPPYTKIYTGIWGFNGVLSAGAVGGFFFVMTFHSFLTAMMNVIFTVLVQQGLGLAFRQLRLPVFTLPFVLSTLLFLSVTSTGNYLTRVSDITFPEMHRYEYVQNLRRNKLEAQQLTENLPTDVESKHSNDEEQGTEERLPIEVEN